MLWHWVRLWMRMRWLHVVLILPLDGSANSSHSVIIFLKVENCSFFFYLILWVDFEYANWNSWFSIKTTLQAKVISVLSRSGVSRLSTVVMMCTRICASFKKFNLSNSLDLLSSNFHTFYTLLGMTRGRRRIFILTLWMTNVLEIHVLYKMASKRLFFWRRMFRLVLRKPESRRLMQR
jgi:hypothetical protein